MLAVLISLSHLGACLAAALILTFVSKNCGKNISVCVQLALSKGLNVSVPVCPVAVDRLNSCYSHREGSCPSVRTCLVPGIPPEPRNASK